MASAYPPSNAKDQSETKDFICCLQFLVIEAANAELPLVSSIIGDAITKINDLCVDQKSQNINITELLYAFDTFVKFYLMGNNSAGEKLLKMMNNIDRKQLESYVH